MIFVRAFHPARFLVTKSASRSRHHRTIPNHLGSCPWRHFSTRNDDEFLTHQGRDITITYITDVEGDKAYLDRYVEMSKVLQFVDASPTTSSFESTSTSDNNSSSYDHDDDADLYFPYDKCIDFSTDDSMLVYGGDVWDKGGFDLYVIRQLISLKQRYPNRVVLVLGNRDINKLRILQEIGIASQKIPHHPGLKWFQGTGRVGDPESNPPSQNPAERLQWMLEQTMGSPDAFEHRRQELAWEESTFNDNKSGNKQQIISDLQVVESYQKSCHPKGELGQYLSQACLAKKLGPLLFVHGSLPLTRAIMDKAKSQGKSVWDDLTPFMPWLKSEQTASDCNVLTIDDWLESLNQFCRDKVHEWKSEIAQMESTQDGRDEEESDDKIWAYKGGYHYGPSYSGLIQYGMGMLPGRLQPKVNPSVVYSSFTPSGMPDRFIPGSEEEDYMHCTKEFFERANVDVILVGHKPQGDLPSPIRVDSSSWVLCCDTSYSGDTIWHHHDDKEKLEPKRSNLGRGDALSFRGDIAVSEVLLELSSGPDVLLNGVKYHGFLSDGTEYGTVNLLDHAHDSSIIGQVAPDHLVPSESDSPHQGRWWTKSVFSDGLHLFQAGEGFNIWNFVSKPPHS